MDFVNGLGMTSTRWNLTGSRQREDLIVKSEKTHRETWGKLGEMMEISPGKIMVSRESDGTKLGISQKVFFRCLKKSGIYPEKAVFSKNTYDWPVDLGEKGMGQVIGYPMVPLAMGWFVVVYHSKDGPRWLVPWPAWMAGPIPAPEQSPTTGTAWDGGWW